MHSDEAYPSSSTPMLDTTKPTTGSTLYPVQQLPPGYPMKPVPESDADQARVLQPNTPPASQVVFAGGRRINNPTQVGEQEGEQSGRWDKQQLILVLAILVTFFCGFLFGGVAAILARKSLCTVVTA